jgi:hypothetical protein
MLHTLRFSLQNAVFFIMLPFLLPLLITFYIQSVLKFKCKTPMPKVKCGHLRYFSNLKIYQQICIAVKDVIWKMHKKEGVIKNPQKASKISNKVYTRKVRV